MSSFHRCDQHEILLSQFTPIHLNTCLISESLSPIAIKHTNRYYITTVTDLGPQATPFNENGSIYVRHATTVLQKTQVS